MVRIECVSLRDMCPAPIPPKNVICLGNFDGVHVAHRQLLRKAVQMRDQAMPDATCSVFCFYHPSADYLVPEKSLHLSTLKEKLSYFSEEGMEYVFLADFPQIKDFTPMEFVSFLMTDCRGVGAVCGYNYRFGKGGLGTPSDLCRLLNAPVCVCDQVCLDGKPVSSTRIRTLLLEGKAEEACLLLARPYSFCAEVMHGKALGKKLGFPTINQNIPAEMLIPRHGVYITDCEIDGKHYRGVSNIGVHPTVDQDSSVNCETFLLDYSGDLYGRLVRTSFLSFIRPEQRFASVSQLCAQIENDVRLAKKYTL